MRMYEAIWNKLKSMPPDQASTKGVSVTANRLLHPRIIKAVTKEKWLDLGYKIEIEPRKAILTHARKHAVLTFYLTITVNSINEECV